MRLPRDIDGPRLVNVLVVLGNEAPQRSLQARVWGLDSFSRGVTMRRTILFSLIALLALSAANDACAQHRGGGRPGSARRGNRIRHARAVSPSGPGYGYLPFDSGDAYDYEPQRAIFVQQPRPLVQAAAPAAVQPAGNAVVTEYKWPAEKLASSRSAHSISSEPEQQPFGIVLKNGSTLSAVSVFASEDGLHCVDPDAKPMRISMSEVDRAATLKLNRSRNLDLYLPAAQ